DSDMVTVNARSEQTQPVRYYGITTITTTAGLWQTKSFMSGARSRLAGVLFPPNGRIYAVGGETGSSGNPAIEEYDPAGDAWTLRAPLQVAVSNVGAAV